MQNIHWRPYPLAKKGEPFPKLIHDLKGSNFIQKMSSTPFILAGGGHIRDIETLERALLQLPKEFKTPFVIFGPIAPSHSHHVPVFYKESLTLDEYLQTAQHCLFSVIPLRDTPSKAAGISLMSASIINGRPVIATATKSAMDHLEDGVDSIFVEEQSIEDLQQAILRLAFDKDLRQELSAGAQRNSKTVSVREWASEIVDGCPARRQKLKRRWKSW